jgi:hypothetical protein
MTGIEKRKTVDDPWNRKDEAVRGKGLFCPARLI